MRILKKKCSKCKKEKTFKSFGKDSSKPNGLYSSCNLCRQKLYSGPKYSYAYLRGNKLRQKYGITLEQYDEMLERQGGRCAICGGLNKNGWFLAVDHDHKTGKNRGLLCASCNVILGTAYDNVDILNKAIKYLEEYNNG